MLTSCHTKRGEMTPSRSRSGSKIPRSRHRGDWNISNSSGELAGEPSPYRNWERSLVLAFANLPRKQWTDDLFQESFRLTASHLEGRVDPAHQLHNPMIQERDAGLEAHGHAHAVFHGEELRQVDPQIVIEAFVENLVRGRLLEGSHVALARGVASQSVHKPGVQQRMARRLHATVGRNPSVLEGAGLTTESVIESLHDTGHALSTKHGARPMIECSSSGWSEVLNMEVEPNATPKCLGYPAKISSPPTPVRETLT